MTECHWTADEDAVWSTDCGQAFILNDGGPTDNGMKHCCYCGEKLVEVTYSGD